MGLFKSKYEKALDEIIFRLQMNLSNNYKDNAQDCLRELEESLETMRSSRKVKEAVISKYDSVVSVYKEKLKGYSHKDQKPYWH